MTEKTIKCENCTREYTYEPPKGYPDKRKYCDVCSFKKNADFQTMTGQGLTEESFEPEVIKIGRSMGKTTLTP